MEEMKAQISLVESIFASIILIVAFSMMINTGERNTDWEDSVNVLVGRDSLVTAERMGNTYEYSFSDSFKTDLLSKISSIRDSTVEYSTDGAIKQTIYVSCDCTNDQISFVRSILSDIQFNGRSVNADVCSTSLSNINPCTSTQEKPDVLIIWGYKNLVPYTQTLLDLKNSDAGIIEIADMQESEVDSAQQSVFGLKWFTNDPLPSIIQDEFLKPRNSSLVAYSSYKWFHSLPYLLNAPTAVGTVPVQNPPGPICATVKEGNFEFQQTDHKFWICDANSAYFDSNGDNNADVGPVILRSKFSLSNSNFFLNYMESDRIRISFKPDYKFNDFLITGEKNKISPVDGDKNKVLLILGYWDINRENPISVSVFSGAKNSRTAWIADFARSNDFQNLGDDHRQLLASLIYSMSNKGGSISSDSGQISSYINVNGTDVFEVYQLDLKIGKPF